jgi:hypothetical protein
MEDKGEYNIMGKAWIDGKIIDAYFEIVDGKKKLTQNCARHISESCICRQEVKSVGIDGKIERSQITGFRSVKR